MNIYTREVKNKLKSALLWSVSIFLLILMFMSFYPSISKDASMLVLVMENYPEEMLKAFGMIGVDLGTVAGYFTMSMLFTQICLAIQASNYGFSILSVEERELTADFLLTKPVKRSKIFFSKLLSAITALVITNASVWGSTFLWIEAFRNGKEYDPALFVKLLSVLILFQLFFLGVGMVISVSVKKIRSVLSFSMALAFGLYIISTIGSIIGENTLGYITPFKYFEPNTLIINGKYDPVMIYICVVVIIVSMLSSFILYSRRNIHSAS